MENNRLNDSKKLRAMLRLILSAEGVTITDLARQHGMTGSSLCNAFYVPFPKAERIIANVLKIQPQQLWPERYDLNGKPNRPNLWYQRGRGGWKPKAKNITCKIKVNRKKEVCLNGTTDKE